MKRRQKEKIVKRKINKILEKIKKHISIVDIEKSTYWGYGSCSFKLKDCSIAYCGFHNVKIDITERKEKANFPLTLFTVPINSYKLASCYAKDINVSYNDISQFVCILKAVLNDPYGRLKDPKDSVEEFKSDLEEYIREEKSQIIGIHRDKYHKDIASIKSLIRNIDYNKISALFIRFDKNNERGSYGRVALIKILSKGDENSYKYCNELEKEFEKYNTHCLCNRGFNLRRYSKRKRKEWLVYDKNAKGVKLHDYVRYL